MFDQPPIVIHHDFDQCDLPLDEFPPNVEFVRPYVKTGWADWSLTEATVRAIAQMYRAPDPPRRFVVLSAADYPIKPASQILSGLEEGDYDAHIMHVLISRDNVSTHVKLVGFERYLTKVYDYPSLNKKLRPRIRELRLSHPLLTKHLLPFVKENLQCYAGWQWFCGNEKVAHAITEFHRTRPALAKFYSSRPMCAEESYFQTILANTPGLKLLNDDYRYVDWSAGGGHPKTLGMEDLPTLLASNRHFARKFDETNTQILDELDNITK